jgi:nucleoside-diphosphate-sugar epimerase
VEIVEASFNDRKALARAADGAEVVYHVAASKSGPAASEVANTVVGSDHLFEAAVSAHIRRFVLVSSLGVLGASSQPGGAVIDERTPLENQPAERDPYSFAKLRQEQLGWKYHRESGLPLVVVRPGVIFGPGQDILTSRIGLNLFGVFLHLGGGNTIPLTHVDNCADGVVQAGLRPGVDGEAFCLVDDDLPTSRQLLRRYRREVKRIPYVPVPLPVLHAISRVNVWYTERTEGHLPAVFTPYKVDTTWKGHRFSNEKAKRLLDWSPRIPMQDALDMTFAELTRAKKPH